MLVLSRKRFENIWIGQNIRITVTEIANGKVRIGIDAPEDVSVCREELLSPQEIEDRAKRLEARKPR